MSEANLSPRRSGPAHATALEAIAYPLLTEAEAFDWQLGPPAQPLCPGPGCIGRLALPTISEHVASEAWQSDTSTTEHVASEAWQIAIQNAVSQPGLTDAAIFLYDQNGLVDILCETLNDQQLEYINLADWNYIQPGFKGSAVISATTWEHPVFDPAGQLKVNPVGLAGVIIERSLAIRNPKSEIRKTHPATTAPAVSHFPSRPSATNRRLLLNVHKHGNSSAVQLPVFRTIPPDAETPHLHVMDTIARSWTGE